MLRAAKQFGPSLYGFAASLYGNGKQDLAYFLDGADVETIECETGVTQGCGLGTLLFALAFHECIIAELEEVLFQIVYTTSAVVHMVGIDGRALARDYSLRPVLG